MARIYLRAERVNHTLQPTALVNEAYLRLAQSDGVNWKNRGHFFGVAARLMREVLVDHARAHSADKRGGGAANIPLDEVFVYTNDKSAEFVALNDALSRLALQDPRKANVVELKFFAGLNFEQIAAALDVHERTAKRDWELARAWLHSELTQ